jgi:hypothetical protein
MAGTWLFVIGGWPLVFASSRKPKATATSQLASGSFQLISQDIAHEMRLQFMGAGLAANVQRSFFPRQLFAPGSEVEHGRLELLDGGPHQPPAIVSVLDLAAIRTGTTIERIGFHNTAA